MTVGQEIDDFVTIVCDRVADCQTDAPSGGGEEFAFHMMCASLPLDEWSKRIRKIFGEDKLAIFFRESELNSPGVPLDMHIVRLIYNAIQKSCCPLPGNRFVMNKERLLADVNSLSELVLNGKFNFTISLRLTNVDIQSDVAFDEFVVIRKLTPEIVNQKYPLNRTFMAVPEIFASHWAKHCVEVVIKRNGTLKEYEQLQRMENTGELVNSILHAFTLSGVCGDSVPYVTHVLRESPVGGGCLLYGAGGISPTPKMYEAEQMGHVIAAYQFLKEAPADPVLEVAIDRFLIGATSGAHHPNKVNQPNWDKIVDYVIALESILLTTFGSSSSNHELSYRFRLNGSSLLYAAIRNDRRRTFCAFKHLYDLRSKVVHGDAGAALKTANRFIDELGIDDAQHKHPIGRLKLVVDQVEDWQRLVFKYLGGIHRRERPYAKQDGWENMLWETEV